MEINMKPIHKRKKPTPKFTPEQRDIQVEKALAFFNSNNFLYFETLICSMDAVMRDGIFSGKWKPFPFEKPLSDFQRGLKSMTNFLEQALKVDKGIRAQTAIGNIVLMDVHVHMHQVMMQMTDEEIEEYDNELLRILKEQKERKDKEQRVEITPESV